MHADELAVDEPLVRRLLADQFPQWAELPLARVEPSGTVNAIWRLGDELAVRLPRLQKWSDEGFEVDWLPRLAPALPLAAPAGVGRGDPGHGYPCRWSIVTWVEGEPGVDAPWDSVQAAQDLAAFVAALQRVDPGGGPPGRDRLAYRDAETRSRIAQMGRRAIEVWEEALAAPPWTAAPVWNHGDLDARNWLVRDGRLTGVIDWGSAGVGDPAADAMAAWKLHSPAAAQVFRDALAVDEATWTRARGWAVSQAAMALTYYTPENNPTLVAEAERWLALALDDASV